MNPLIYCLESSKNVTELIIIIYVIYNNQINSFYALRFNFTVKLTKKVLIRVLFYALNNFFCLQLETSLSN